MFAAHRRTNAACKAKKRAIAARRAEIWVFLVFKLAGYSHTCAYMCLCDTYIEPKMTTQKRCEK